MLNKPSRRARQASQGWRLPRGAGLGPAQVIRAGEEDPEVQVLLADGRCVSAAWAIPYRYVAKPGDQLLVISQGERHYVLSVLQGRGRSVLATRGDALLRAEAGKLALRGEKGVRLRGARLTLRGQRLGVAVRRIHEKLGEVSSRIVGQVFERAGSSRRVIDEDDWHAAEARTLVAVDSVTFNGDLIRVS
jgi:uncharacterized protein DUF3540